MGNVTDDKFTWVMDFSSLQSKFIESDRFVIGGYKWRLALRPIDMRYRPTKHLTLLLGVADLRTFPCGGWRIHAKCRLTLVNQLSEELSLVQEKQHWFEQERPGTSYRDVIPLTKLYEKDGGFLVNNQVKVLVEIDVLEVVGILDVLVESLEEVTQPLKKTKLNDDAVESTLAKESIDVNGFQVLPSQAESVKRIFEKHPNMVLDFQAKNQRLRTSCMNVLLDLIETLCLQDLSIDDLGQADNALTYLKYSGFKVDWLECKLEQVKAKKIEEDISETRILELEEELKDIGSLLEKKKEELKDLKQKCSDSEALLKKEKAKLLAARAPPLTLDDVV